MLMKDSEEKRSTAWRTVLTVSSVLLVIVVVFFIVKLFTGNPLEGTYDYNIESGMLTLSEREYGSSMVFEER